MLQSIELLKATQPLNNMDCRTISFLVVALALPSYVAASAWVEVGDSRSVAVFVDKDSIRRKGANVKAWLKWVWSKPIEVANSVPPKYYLLQRQLDVFNCQKNTYAIVQDTSYSDAAGNEVVNSYAFEEKDWQFSESAPDTIGESIQKFVCKPTMKK